MARYALQANIYTDNSSMSINDVKYTRSLEANIETGNSNLNIDRVNYTRALTTTISTDKSSIIAAQKDFDEFIKKNSG